MATYKSEKAKKDSIALYEKQINQLNACFEDIFVKTTYGNTHVVETGNKNGEPLLVFHGGNSTTSYNLLAYHFLLDKFHIFAVDTIGHPGKSEEVNLSHKTDDYGLWASEVISLLGFDSINCLGVSFGGGILAKLLGVAPKKVSKAVLIVPAGINNAFPLSTVKMMIPLVKYQITKKENYLIDTILHMAIKKEVIDNDTLDIVKDSFDNVITKVGMPSNVDETKLREVESPVLVMAAERDCLFPANKVIPKAAKVFKNGTVYTLENRGHMHRLTNIEEQLVTEFLLR